MLPDSQCVLSCAPRVEDIETYEGDDESEENVSTGTWNYAVGSVYMLIAMAPEIMQSNQNK